MGDGDFLANSNLKMWGNRLTQRMDASGDNEYCWLLVEKDHQNVISCSCYYALYNELEKCQVTQ